MQTAPYIQSFDNDTTPSCWTNPVNIVFGTPIYWYSANNTSSNPGAYAPSGLAATIGDHTGNNGFYMYAYRGWNSTLQLTSPDIDVSSLSTPTLSFWMFAHTTSAQNNVLTVDVYDGIWHPAVATFNQSNPNWTNKTVNLAAFAGDTIKVRFRRGNTFNGNQDILLDDVFIGELPTCLPPTSLMVDSVHANQAFITINGTTANIWEYEYGTSGFALGSGIRDTTSQNLLALLNLSSNTMYDVYVRNKCSPSDTSLWLQTSFTSLCGVFTAPFTETFDLTTTPDCWSNYSTVIPNYLIGFSSAEDHTGNNGASANWNYFAAAPILHLESPEIDLTTLSQPYLTFYRKAYVAYLHPQAFDGSVTAEAFDGANWIALKSYSSNDPNWQFNAIDLQGLNLPDTAKFRLKFARSGGYVTNVYLDDFSIVEKPSCLPTDSMFVNSMTTNAVSMKFTGIASRQIEWGIKGFLHGNGNYVSTSTTSALLIGTLPATAYTAYYRDSCASGYSEWSEAVHFETPCLSVSTIPYLQSFNSLPPQDTSFSSVCWTSYTTCNTHWMVDLGTPSGSTGPSLRHDGSFAFTEATGGNILDESYLESPLLDLSNVNNPYLRFYYHMFGNTMGDLCVEVFQTGVWQALDSCLIGQQQSTESSPWLQKKISLVPYVNSTIKVRFKGIRGSGFASDMAIDDILFIDSCAVPIPIAGFSYTLDSLNASGYFVAFSSNAMGASSVLWDFGDGTTDTAANPMHVYTTNGSFRILQTASNSCGETDTISQIIVINGVSIDEKETLINKIKVYPNPVKSSLTINAGHLQIYKVQVFNLVGQEVLHTEHKGITKLELDVSQLPNNIYILDIQTSHGSIRRKIEKQ